MNRIRIFVMATFLLGQASAWGNQPSDNASAQGSKEAAVTTFRQAHPSVLLHETNNRITQAAGPMLSTGADAISAAEQFRVSHAEMFGAKAADLKLGSRLIETGPETLPLMYDAATQSYKFTLVCYRQERGGVPVFRGELRALVRNEANAPVVLVNSSARELGDFTPALRAATVTNDDLQRIAKSEVPSLSVFSPGHAVIWAGYDEIDAQPALAYELTANSGDVTSPAGYQEWLFVVDVSTGAVLYKENQVHTTDVSGTVTGVTTDMPAAAECLPENPQPMPYASVNIQGQGTFYTDVNGNYTLPNPGDTPVTVESRLTGRRFIISDQAGAPPVLSASVTPPGPGDFQHNAANTSEFVRASVNAYINANIIRDIVVTANPAYPTIGTQINMGVNTNINQTCNAFYSPTNQTINFYRNGGGCSNTAFSDVVHHEYGHHVVQMGGSGQGQYGEGMGDCMAVLATDQPFLGIGFQGNCSAGIRSAQNTMQYPCSGAIHTCGQLISGCIWDTRNALILSNPGTYRTILSSLTVNSVPLHVGSSTITPQICTDFLTLDDDDANINNGTPHCSEIISGFAPHSMAPAGASGARFTYPNGKPLELTPLQPTSFPVHAFGDFCQTVIPASGTGMIHYRIGGVGPYTSAAMTPTGTNQYQAALPAAGCGQTIEFYVSTDLSPSGTFTDPPNAPTSVHSAIASITAVSLNFETSPGWTVSGAVTDGAWDVNPGVPINCGRGDPTSDFDGSSKCMLTDNSAADSCNSDVDGGSTILTSTVFDLSSLTDPRVSYARWYSNTFGAAPQADTFVIEVSRDGGGAWVNLETVGPTTGSPNPEVNGGWFVKTKRIADFLSPPFDQFRIRFNASDLGSGSVVEAGIDAFKITDVCPVCAPPTGDINGDTIVDGNDVAALVASLMGTQTLSQVCAGDFNSTGILDIGDVDGFVAALLGP